MKVGFIGFGNMAQALADGFLTSGALSASDIYCCARDKEKLQANALKRGCNPCANAKELVRNVDTVIIAVKPSQVDGAVAPVRKELKEKVVISVVNGLLFDSCEQVLDADTPHVSILPNTPVAIGKGVIIIEDRHSLSDEQMEEVTSLLSSVAVIEKVGTETMSAAGTLSGCGPAFAAIFMESLADAGVKHGLRRETATRLAAAMLSGTALLQLVSGKHPAQMKDEVCSPSGTTIKGVYALEREGFRAAVIAALDAATEK